MTEYEQELRQRVRDAWRVLKRRHKLRRYDQCIADPGIRSELLAHVMRSPWTESHILACFRSMQRAKGDDHATE